MERAIWEMNVMPTMANTNNRKIFNIYTSICMYKKIVIQINEKTLTSLLVVPVKYNLFNYFWLFTRNAA